MKEKHIVLGDFIDPDTGLRFVEDDRGVYHLIRQGEGSGNTDSLEREVKRLRRVTEALRSENNWLWGILHKALEDDRKQSASYAIRQLQKAIKERTRL